MDTNSEIGDKEMCACIYTGGGLTLLEQNNQAWFLSLSISQRHNTLPPPEPFHLVLTVGPPLPLPFAPSESNCARRAEWEVNLWLVS